MIIWTNDALLDLKRIKIFLEESSVPIDIVETIVQQIRIEPEKLINMPKRGQRINTSNKQEIRRLLIKGYKVSYEITDDAIFILSVFHSKEDIEGI